MGSSESGRKEVGRAGKRGMVMTETQTYPVRLVGATRSENGAHAEADDQYLHLNPEHVEVLSSRAVPPCIANERGYNSEQQKSRLKLLGFGVSQQRPGLVISRFNPRGEKAAPLLRPTEPRLNNKGHAIKYEAPSKSVLCLDVHPSLSRPRRVDITHPDQPEIEPPLIRDRRFPLFMTESVLKGDALVGLGLIGISIQGVYGFRGKNETGDSVALADLEDVSLKGRDVILVPDSDVQTNPDVHRAVARWKALLENRGAHVSVALLPIGERGTKTGVDDFIARLKAEGLDDELIRIRLRALEIEKLPAAPAGAGSTTDAHAIENALAEVEAAATAPQRAQYLDDKGRLVHGVPLGKKLALVKGVRDDTEREIELIAEPEVLPTRSSLSPKGLRRYRDGATVSPRDVIDRLHQYISTRLVFRFPWQARLVALWIFGTYLHVLFEYYGYLHGTSPSKRAGKSKLLELIASVAFNASGVSANPTAAIIFRDAHRNCATQLYDELEKLDDEKRADVMAVLNVGFHRRATVARVLDPQADTMREFSVYSPKAFASIQPLSDTTQDRSIRIELLRKLGSEKIKRSGDRVSIAEATGLRDDCHIAALLCAESVEAIYSQITQLMQDAPVKMPEIDDRAHNILEPLTAIAIVADDEGDATYYPAMIDAARAIAGVRADVGNDESNLIAAAEALRQYADGRDSFAITGEQAFELFKNLDELRWIESEGGAKALLRKAGFNSSAHRRNLFLGPLKSNKDVIKGYLVQRAHLQDLLERYRPKNAEAEVSEEES